MILIAVVDDNNGMLFNKRRQSKDAVLRQRIVEITSGSNLYMNEYSAKQFTDFPDSIKVCTLPQGFNDTDYLFIENVSAKDYEAEASKIILYHWNRTYPGDLYFDIELSNYTCIAKSEFAGKSHDCITEEIYEKTKSKCMEI